MDILDQPQLGAIVESCDARRPRCEACRPTRFRVPGFGGVLGNAEKCRDLGRDDSRAFATECLGQLSAYRFGIAEACARERVFDELDKRAKR